MNGSNFSPRLAILSQRITGQEMEGFVAMEAQR